jgi:hypothetical protein
MKEKERKSKKKHHKTNGELVLCDTQALTSLFKDQFIRCKAGNIWAELRDWIG